MIILLEVPSLAAQGTKKDLGTFWVLLAISFLFSLGMVQGWPLPNPTPVLETVFRPVSDLLGLK